MHFRLNKSAGSIPGAATSLHVRDYAVSPRGWGLFPAWPTPAEPGFTVQKHHIDMITARPDCQRKFQPQHDGIDAGG
jgi:hypothetical protein